MRTRDRIAAISVSATAVASMAMLGSAPRWATCAAVFAAIVCVLPYVTSRRRGSAQSPVLWLLGVAAAFTGAQLIPLPASWVAALAPAKYALLVDNASALGERPPGYMTLTYDAPATWLELCKLFGYLAFAFACTRLAAGRPGRLWLARTVAGVGIALAVCALGHHLLGLDTLFAVYQPRAQTSSYLAPLLNENHLSGFLAFTVPLAIALAITAHGLRRFGWAGGAVLCAGQALLLQSRGAAVAMTAGLALMGALMWLHNRRERRGHTAVRQKRDLMRVVPAGIVVACAVVLVATFTAGGVRDELAATSSQELQAGDTKVGVWRASAELAGENTWTGVGRGAFEYAFTRVYHSGLKTYSHVENEYLQMLVDWGLPATAILFLLMLWVGLSALRHWQRSPLEIGALCALATMGIQSAVDFGVELPGVALSVIALSALLLSHNLERMRGRAQKWHAAGRVAFVALAAAVAVFASTPVTTSASDDAEHLATLLDDREVADSVVIASGRAAFARHPSDYLLAARLAQAYFHRARDPKALALMNRALTLNPNHAGLHAFTAKLLIAGGRERQALIEFSLALRYTLAPGPVLRDLVRAFPDARTAARGIPVSRERMRVMVNRLTTLGHADVALAYAQNCAEEFYSDHDLTNSVTELALQQGDLELAQAQGLRAYRDRGLHVDVLLYGRVLMRTRQPEQAVTVAQAAIDGAERQGLAAHVRLYELLASALLATKKPAETTAVVYKAVDLAVGDRAILARLYRILARAETALGHREAAKKARMLAHDYAAQP